jgi:predicted ABC-type ATPase
MASARAEAVAALDLRDKLTLERRLLRDLSPVESEVVSQFIRSLGLLGLLDSRIGAVHQALVQPVLRNHYERVRRLFANRLQGEPAQTPKETARLREILTGFYDRRAEAQGRVIGRTTQTQALEALQDARSMPEVASMAPRDFAVVAGRFLARKLRARRGAIACLETQTPAEASKQTQADVLLGEAAYTDRPDVKQRLIVTKEWVSQGDSRVRPAHIQADSKVVLQEQPFLVGGQQLMYPGDTSLGATARNVVNCRCSAVTDQKNIFQMRTNELARITGEVEAPAVAPPGQLFPRRRARPDPKAPTSLEKWSPEGQLLPEREALHEEIIGSFTRGAQINKPEGKTFHMIGGGSGAGKGTVKGSGRLGLPTRAVGVDADEIKKGLPEFQIGVRNRDAKAAAFVHDESSQVVNKLLTRSRTLQTDTIFDSTGDGNLEKLRARVLPFREQGYRMKADYVTVPTDVAVERAAIRAAETGRAVPETVIREIHAGVSQTFPQAARADIFDEIRLWDTNVARDADPILIYSRVDGAETIHDGVKWDAFLAKAEELP